MTFDKMLAFYQHYWDFEVKEHFALDNIVTSFFVNLQVKSSPELQSLLR